MRKTINLTLTLFILICMTSAVYFLARGRKDSRGGIHPFELNRAHDHAVPKIMLEKEPLNFIPNSGQENKTVLYYSRCFSYTVWITQSGLLFDWDTRPATFDENNESACLATRGRNVVGLKFIGNNIICKVSALGEMPHKVNIIRGNDPAEWKTNINSYQSVLYKDIYKNIDLKIFGNGEQVEYDWIAKRGCRIGDIKVEYTGQNHSLIDKQGNLILKTDSGELIQCKPSAYQLIAGNKRCVEVNYIRIGHNVYGLAAGGYDHDYDLIIDPIIYSTYFGGSDNQTIYGVDVDDSGCVYITGMVWHSRFPVKNPFQPKNIAPDYTTDAFVTKISADGQSLIYSTYFGGRFQEVARDIAVDNKGSAAITGFTGSFDMPIKHASQKIKRGYLGDFDAFLVKFSPSGSSLVFSTYLGGVYNEVGYGVTIDASDNIYITGRTWSKDFPCLNPWQKSFGGVADAFLAKYSPEGKYIFSTYFGGKGFDDARGVAVGKNGMVYMTGYTDSKDLPVKNAYQIRNAGVCDAFIAAFSSDGSALKYSTYFGGKDNDRAYGIHVSPAGFAFITGCTYSSDFFVKNPYQAKYKGQGDAFLFKLSPDGRKLEYSTYWGGSDWDSGQAIEVGPSGEAYISGMSYSTNLPSKDGFQLRNNGSADAFLAKFSSSGNSLQYASYLGGERFEMANDLALDGAGDCYIGGYTFSYDFPLKNAIQNQWTGGDWTIFLTKITLEEEAQNYPDVGQLQNSVQGQYQRSVNDKTAQRGSETLSRREAVHYSYDPERIKLRDFKTWDNDPYHLWGGGVACGDIDGDGDLDLYVSALTTESDPFTSGYFPTGAPLILLNDGHGYFTDVTDRRFIPNDFYEVGRPSKFSDVDGNNDLDLLLTSGKPEYKNANPPFLPGGQDRLLLNLGKGYFLERTFWRIPDEFNAFTAGIDLSDVDNDADLDIFVYRIGSSIPPSLQSELWLNNGKGIYSIDRAQSFSGCPGMCFGDLNNDKADEIIQVGSGETGEEILIYVNDGKGKFTFLPNGPRNFTYAGAYLPVVADFNQDGKPDIFIANSGDFNSHTHIKNKLLYSTGNLKFKDATDSLHQGTPPWASVYAVSGDIDNDKDIDILVSGFKPIDWSNPKPERSRFYENMGKGVFRDSSTKIPELTESAQIVLGDFDNDGDKDIFLCSSFQSKVLINELIPTFRAPKDFKLINYISANFQGMEENEYSFKWNNDSASPYKVTKYRLYKFIDDHKMMVSEVPSASRALSYKDRSGLPCNRFGLVAVDKKDKESCIAYLEIK